MTLIALGDPQQGFFRPTDVPVHIIRSPAGVTHPTDTAEQALTRRIFAHIETMSDGLAAIGQQFDIVHTQDCIAARAAARIRDGGAGFKLLRTVHHIDDFTTPALVNCQNAAIVEPDHVLVVSEPWRRRLQEEYGVAAEVVHNGVRAERFTSAKVQPDERQRLRARIGAGDRHLFLTVGGIEPRKGSRYLIEALGLLRARPGADTMLAVIGGHSFQDYRAYRDEVLDSLGQQGLRLGHDVILVGTVPDAELPGWYHAADSFVFPSVSEGWGLVVLEALAAGLPVVTSDIEVFRSFLTADVDAVLTVTGDPHSLTEGMARVRDDADLRQHLSTNGPVTASRYSWSNAARHHMEIYARVRHEHD